MGGSTNIFAQASSKATGGQAFPPDVYNPLLTAREITSSTSQAQCFFNKGSVMYVHKNDFGTGNVLTDAYLRVHWAPF